ACLSLAMVKGRLSLHDALPISGLDSRSTMHRTIVAPISTCGTRTVVSRGEICDAAAKSLLPTIEISSGILRPSCSNSLTALTARSEEHTSELQSREKHVCRILL